MREISKEELGLILEKHKKWLNNEDGGERADLNGANLRKANLREADLRVADLCEADLSGADLREADICGADICRTDLSETNLRGADLRGADICGADLDYSVMYFGCKDLDHHVDDKLAIQRLYHTLRNIKFSKNVSQELKDKLLTNEILEIANRFHKVDECGVITSMEGEDKR